MTIDYLDYAMRLTVVNVFRPGNPTGFVTDPRLYDTKVFGSRAPGWPSDGKGRGGIKHATVGNNSLEYLARGSIRDNRWVSAHYLLPKDEYTIYKMIPDGYGCNHAYPASWRSYVNNLNSNFYGFEVENLQNGKDPFTDGQYIKFALTWYYLATRDGIADVMLVDHGKAAPAGHRTDPWTGGVWDEARFYGHLAYARLDERLLPFWGL
jgi:hypothetical protein